jgi:RHS repeat-associated protein
MGSTAYTARENTKAASFYAYDEWSKPRAIQDATEHDLTTPGRNDANQFALDGLGTDYTGYTYDRVLDKYFDQYRMYDATNKRFVELDPVKDGYNWYNYVQNSPINAIDPLGLAKLKGIAWDYASDIGDTYPGTQLYSFKHVLAALYGWDPTDSVSKRLF